MSDKIARLYKTLPGQERVEIWTGLMGFTDQESENKATRMVIGQTMVRMADDLGGEPDKDAMVHAKKTAHIRKGGEVVATLELTFEERADPDAWVDKPDLDGMWWYVDERDGERFVGLADVEMDSTYPVSGIIGSDEIYNFKDFTGPWKMAVLPEPPPKKGD